MSDSFDRAAASMAAITSAIRHGVDFRIVSVNFESDRLGVNIRVYGEIDGRRVGVSRIIPSMDYDSGVTRHVQRMIAELNAFATADAAKDGGS